MANILLTFLGRVPKTENGYRPTRYDFGDGTTESPSAFFGWVLQRRLRPDRFIILGTSGSMWDHLVEDEPAFQEGSEAALALIDAVNAKSVAGEHLSPWIPILNERLGCDVHLELIPYARDTGEQVELLRIMAAHVEAGDRVDLDVTHGFRHLPMLAILAALHLRSVRRATIGGIWYGAFDPDSGEAPVHDLAGLLHIADWLQALHTYEKDGDYGVFGALLGPAGTLLEEAAFFERTSNPVKAREKLITWTNRADRVPADDPAAALFSDLLHERIRWYRQETRAQWEQTLADEYLSRGDHVRAVIYGLESCISAEVLRQQGNASVYEAREQASQSLTSKQAFKTLRRIRNALAHGARPEIDDVTQIICHRKQLANTLRVLWRTLRG